jgi:glycosyltransferase involved in cell wall biosynthesis
MTKVLRILHIASGDLWAGAEVQAFTLISYLARMPATEVAAVLMNNAMLAERLRSIGVATYVLDEHEIHPLEMVMRLRRVLRSWKPDLIHTHRQKENILGSLANRSCRNVPCVRTVHGANEHAGTPGWRGLRHRTVVKLDQWCGRVLQQRIIAVTQELGTLMSTDFPVGKIAIIENGVDAEMIRGERRPAEFRLSAPLATHIGIAGRLVEVKRVDLFLETAARLLEEYPQRKWQFHVFGDGPKRRSLEELSRRLRISEKVAFHGHRSDIATCVGGLDALVVCSDHEGMPMVSLEACALEVPTVAHAVGGLAAVVPSEFLVTRHDSHGYRDGIVRALAFDARSIISRHAAEVLGRFSARRNAERVRSLYEQLVSEKS